jgi:hypothetical protein
VMLLAGSGPRVKFKQPFEKSRHEILPISRAISQWVLPTKAAYTYELEYRIGIINVSPAVQTRVPQVPVLHLGFFHADPAKTLLR